MQPRTSPVKPYHVLSFAKSLAVPTSENLEIEVNPAVRGWWGVRDDFWQNFAQVIEKKAQPKF